jgi:hypothetical protein
VHIPGALSDGTILLIPSNTPVLLTTLNVDSLSPPMTGSFVTSHLRSAAPPSNEDRTTVERTCTPWECSACVSVSACMIIGHGRDTQGKERNDQRHSAHTIKIKVSATPPPG